MKLNVKKFACVALTFAIVASASACGKSKKKSSAAIDAANTFLEATVSLDAKKVKKLEKSLGVDSDFIAAVDEFADEEAMKAVFDKATFEIDEDSLKEKKSSASVNATINLPDYEDAFDSADGDIDDFIDEIDGQKEKNYNAVEVTLKFDVEDDEYIMTNAEDFYEDVYEPVFNVIGDGDVDPVDPTPADTTPADTTPADTTPADTTPADTTPADTTPADTTPADTTPADTTGATVDPTTLDYLNLNKAPLDLATYKSAISAADPSAFVVDSDPSEAPISYTVTDYVAVLGETIGAYYGFASAEDAHKYFEETCAAASSMASGYKLESDYGYMIFISGDTGIVYYFSGTGFTMFMYSMEEAPNNVVSSFFHNIGAC